MKLVGCPDRLRSALLPSKLTSITNKKIKYSHLTRMHPLGSFGFLDLTVVPVPLCVLVPSDFNICLLTNYTKIPGVSSNEGGYVSLQNYPGLGSAECILHEEQEYIHYVQHFYGALHLYCRVRWDTTVWRLHGPKWLPWHLGLPFCFTTSHTPLLLRHLLAFLPGGACKTN